MAGLQNDYRDDDGKPRLQGRGQAKGMPQYLNPIAMMAISGARGNVDQIRQLGGMRGLMAKPSGEIIETPIKSNFREGLSVLEYFSSTHGARKGLADTALKTADSGYLTRKLADVAQNVIINEIDCGTLNGVTKTTIYKGETVEVELKDMIVGRTARDTIRNPITDETIVEENQIDHPRDRRQAQGPEARDRSACARPLTCESPRGICARCYGVDMSHQPARRRRPGGRHHRRPVDRRARHAADHAYVPHRRRRHRVADRERHQGGRRRHRRAPRHQRGRGHGRRRRQAHASP